MLRAAPVVAEGGVPLRPGDDVLVRFREHGVVPSGRGVGVDYRLVLVSLREHTVGSTVVVKSDFARAVS